MNIDYCASPKCEKDKIGDSIFCKDHSKKYKSLYLKYKNTEASIDDKIIDNVSTIDNIYDLLKTYARLESSYKQRVDFRSKALDIIHWDYGHNNKIKNIVTSMNDIVSRLKELFFNQNIKDEDVNNEINKEDVSNEVKEEDDTLVPKIKDITKKHLKIIKQEENFDECISEHQRILDIKSEKSTKIFHLLDSLIQKHLDVDYVFGIAHLYIIIMDFLQYNIYKTTLVTQLTITKSFIDKFDKALYANKKILIYFKEIYKKFLGNISFIEKDFLLSLYLAYKKSLAKTLDLRIVMNVVGNRIVFFFPGYNPSNIIILPVMKSEKSNKLLLLLKNSSEKEIKIFFGTLKLISNNISKYTFYCSNEDILFKIQNSKRTIVEKIKDYSIYLSILSDITKDMKIKDMKIKDMKIKDMKI